MGMVFYFPVNTTPHFNYSQILKKISRKNFDKIEVFITKEFIMKKIVRLTESDLVRIVKRIIKESPDPTLDFILTDDEKTCLNPRYKNLSNAKKRRWYVDEVKQKLILGELDSSSMLVPYCSYDINNRPLHPSKDQGMYVYDVNTGVISFG